MDAGNLSKRAQLILQKKGFSLIGLRECKLDEEFSSFSKALSNAVDHNAHGPFVDKRSTTELKESGARPFLSLDRMAGIAVWPDGNIGAAFKDSRSLNGHALGELILTALSIGGNKLDCYNGGLAVLYAMFGFIPVARVSFDWGFAPKNWSSVFGTPDVIFWIHCGNSVETVARKIYDYPPLSEYDLSNLPCFDTYEEAYQYRDNKKAGKL